MFPSIPTLDTLYKFHLDSAFKGHPTQEYLLNLLGINFSKLHAAYSMDYFDSNSSVIELHSFNLQQHYQFFTSIYDDNVCLSCLTAKPEHALSCGHSICKICIHNFGIPTGPYRYILQNCILCNKNIAFRIALKPPTAGVRVLCIDGGGIRGVVPLLVLREVESSIGLPCKLQEHFDLVVGTSSGISVLPFIGSSLISFHHRWAYYSRFILQRLVYQ